MSAGEPFYSPDAEQFNAEKKEGPIDLLFVMPGGRVAVLEIDALPRPLAPCLPTIARRPRRETIRRELEAAGYRRVERHALLA